MPMSLACTTLCVIPQGQATDIAIQAEEILKMKKVCNQILAGHTGQPLDKIGELGSGPVGLAPSSLQLPHSLNTQRKLLRGTVFCHQWRPRSLASSTRWWCHLQGHMFTETQRTT